MTREEREALIDLADHWDEVTEPGRAGRSRLGPSDCAFALRALVRVLAAPVEDAEHRGYLEGDRGDR
jgi:hypothetical protein